MLQGEAQAQAPPALGLGSMAEGHSFRRAAEARDVDLMAETLRDDVVLHSPVLFRGFEGREAVGAILGHVGEVLEGLEYTDEAAGEGTVVLRFEARVGDLELEGVDYLQLDDDGLVTDLTVFMRPMSALTAFNERMAERLGVDLPTN
jgi:SnoaL-like domain